MKILIVSNYYYPEHTGGIETVSYNLIRFYRNAGHKVFWIAADVPPRFRIRGDDDLPVRSWNITEDKLGFPQPIPHPIVLMQLLRGVHDSDVVHLQDCLYLINILAFFVAKILGKPILITQYAKLIPYDEAYKRVLQKVAYHTIGWLMFTTADKVVFITANVRDHMSYINSQKMRDIVPLGVDTEFYSPISEVDRRRLRKKITGDTTLPIVLFVGRMVARKGIQLIRPLIEKHKEWHWVLVGRPDDFNPTEWKYENLTYFQHASEQQLQEFYGIADILVHPSIGEGLTLVVSESLATGTPVLLSHESLYEVDAIERSLFFAAEPDIEDIEEKLVDALSDITKLTSLRKACREFALNRLSWKAMTDQYLKLLKQLTKKETLA